MRWFWLCPVVVGTVVVAVVWYEILTRFYEEGVAWRRAWVATEPPELAGYDDNPIPPEYVIGLPHWRRQGP